MARFDEEFIQRLKDETDIVRLIESYGTKLKDRGTGGEMIGLCPIHDDKNPSLVVNRQKNVWNCLGACGKGGDVIQWVMHAEKASFRHAIELLRDGAENKRGRGSLLADWLCIRMTSASKKHVAQTMSGESSRTQELFS